MAKYSTVSDQTEGMNGTREKPIAYERGWMREGVNEGVASATLVACARVARLGEWTQRGHQGARPAQWQAGVACRGGVEGVTWCG